MPQDVDAQRGKGFAFVQYVHSDDAVKAMEGLDGSVFQGRLLHVLPSSSKREAGIDDYTLSKLPIKRQNQIKKRMEASSSIFKWNSLYMNVRTLGISQL